MTLSLTDFAASDRDYVAKMNANNASIESAVNDLIAKVFHRKLSDADLERLRLMQQTSRTRILALRKRLLTPAQCEQLVARAAAKGLATQRVEQIAPDNATEGWNLETRGYVPHAVVARGAAAPRQVALPL